MVRFGPRPLWFVDQDVGAYQSLGCIVTRNSRLLLAFIAFGPFFQ